MKRIAFMLAALLLAGLTCQLLADVTIEETGRWPNTWPQELEPLRAHSRTIEGPLGGFLTYEISFTERDAFESAWPHLLKVKSAETPILLIRSPYIGTGALRGTTIKSGVLIGSLPVPEGVGTTTLALVVDGDVIDLNRIRLPRNTHIQDERFNDDGETER